VPLPGTGIALSFAPGIYAFGAVYVAAARYFGAGVLVHGQQGGVRDVRITNNVISGIPTGLAGDGLIGLNAFSPSASVTEVEIAGNDLRMLGTGSLSRHVGVWIGAHSRRVVVSGNTFSRFFYGLRSDADVTDLECLDGNVFSQIVARDVLASCQPSGGAGARRGR
jgi:hypothetical protein